MKVSDSCNGVMTLQEGLDLRDERITLCEWLLVLWNATSVAKLSPLGMPQRSIEGSYSEVGGKIL